MSDKKLSQEDRENLAEITRYIIMHGTDEEVGEIAKATGKVLLGVVQRVFNKFYTSIKETIEAYARSEDDN